MTELVAWPVDSLRLTAGGVELRAVDDHAAAALAGSSLGGTTFYRRADHWTRTADRADRASACASWYYRTRGGVSDGSWRLAFAVRDSAGDVVGTWELSCDSPRVVREVSVDGWTERAGHAHSREQTEAIVERSLGMILAWLTRGGHVRAATASLAVEDEFALRVLTRAGFAPDGSLHVDDDGDLRREVRVRAARVDPTGSAASLVARDDDVWAALGVATEPWSPTDADVARDSERFPDELVCAMPVLGLVIRTPRLELRLPTDTEVAELVRAGRSGVHDPSEMPFALPWTDARPGEYERRGFMHHWSSRGSSAPGNWNHGFAVFHDGSPIGCQDLAARSYAVRRVVGSGSWLRAEAQGYGFGTEMRRAVLHLAFEGLGAVAALTDAYEDNAASIAVSRRCGYVPNGRNRWGRARGPLAPGGESTEPVWADEFILTRERWLDHRTDDIELDGVTPEFLRSLGAD